MLAIRMQRTGRKGHSQFRLIVQDKRFSPVSGRVVAFLGNYDPHSKASSLDKEKAAKYLANGAQPTERVAKILKTEGVKLPDWVQPPQKQKKTVKHPEKLRRNRPAGSGAPKEEVSAGEAPAGEKTESPAKPEAPQSAKQPLPVDASQPSERTAEEVPESKKTAEETTTPADLMPDEPTEKKPE